MIPDIEKPRDLEELCLRRIEWERATGRADGNRYGEKTRMVPAKTPFVDYKMVAGNIKSTVADMIRRVGKDQSKYSEQDLLNIAYSAGKTSFELFLKLMPPTESWVKIPSYPDFEMTVKDVGHAIFDCKRCLQASWPITDKYRESTQFKFLIDRSVVGDITFLLIHFNSRSLQSKKLSARTVAFPVHRDLPFWRDETIKRITWEHCDKFGYNVKWSKPPRKRSYTPDLVDAVLGVKNLITKLKIIMKIDTLTIESIDADAINCPFEIT